MSSIRPAKILAALEAGNTKSSIPNFRVGDTVKVHARIVEGQKERVQVFEGAVIRRRSGNQPTATFTVRKISYNVGVERVFQLHSPRIEKIELISHGQVRRSRLYYLRDLRGKASRIKGEMVVPVTGDVELPEAAGKTPAVEAAAAK